MFEDFCNIQLYKTYYTNVKSVLPEYFRKFLPDYNTTRDHNHDLRHTNYTSTNDEKSCKNCIQ